VIHSHEEAAFFSLLLASVFRTKHLYDMHSSLPRQLANFNVGNYRVLVKLFEWLERRTLLTCDALITIGSDLEHYARKINPKLQHVMIENLPVQSIDNGARQPSVEELKQQLRLADRFPIVYTGTFERYQGIGLLIESAKIVREHYPEACFVLVGGKAHQIEHWKSETKKQGLEEHVLFVGTVPVDEVSSYVALAEILVSPRTEGTSVPLKIYSYLLAGKPIVATNLAAHTLVLDKDRAVLTEPTPSAFAGGVLELIQNPAARQRLGQQAQRYAEAAYDPSQYLRKLDHIYQVLQQPRRGHKQQTAS
jgi:glycosyltransferase involved in cell wall biosynthesis